MTREPDDELTPEERSSLAALPPTLNPPDHLERRIEAELHARGLLRRQGSRRWRGAVAAAAVIIAFAAGWGGHGWASRTSRGTVDARPRYMLLLHGAESAPGEELRRVNEYRTWAASVASRGAHVSGEKLDDREIVLGPATPLPPFDQPLGGFFIISAADDRAAETLARTHPHLKYGGRILIRPIATH